MGLSFLDYFVLMARHVRSYVALVNGSDNERRKKIFVSVTEISNDSLADLPETSDQQLKNKTHVSTLKNRSLPY